MSTGQGDYVLTLLRGDGEKVEGDAFYLLEPDTILFVDDDNGKQFVITIRPASVTVADDE